MNRFLLYIGAVLFLSLVGLSIYVFFLRQGTFEEVPVPQDIVIPGSNASVFDPNAPYARVSSKETVAVSVSDGGDVVAVFGDGSVQVFDEQGSLENEYGSGLAPVVKASVSPKGDVVSMLVLTPATYSSRWYRWNFSTGSPVSLSQDIDDIFYSPDGTPTRVYTSDDSAVTRIVVEKNGKEQTILTSRIPDLRARWTDNTNILLTTQPSGEAEGIAYLFNTRTRGTQRLLGGKYGLSSIGVGIDALFTETISQGANKIKTSVYSNGDETTISVITLPERCVIGGTSSFICSTISSVGSAQVMPDDYLKGKVINKTSSLVQIDTITGSVVLLVSVPFDAIKPSLSKSGRFIFTVDKNSGSLWRVRVN